MTWQAIMQKICGAYAEILGPSLSGIYVHGSIAFGCYQPRKSDIDFLAVVDREPDMRQKRQIIRLLMDLSPLAPEKGIEMSVVLREDCRHFTHPTPYVLHYSAAHHEAYARDMDAHILRLRGADPDLAAHFTVTRAVGIALMGPAPQQMFAPVPPEAYLDSIRGDVENAEADVLTAPVYIALNLCRVAAYVREGAVLSKAQGGEWGLQCLPEKWHALLRAALTAYCDGTDFAWDAQELQAFAREMQAAIR